MRIRILSKVSWPKVSCTESTSYLGYDLMVKMHLSICWMCLSSPHTVKHITVSTFLPKRISIKDLYTIPPSC